jgi:S-adenosyl-L-methionine hydrolase (adenosine-forming)
MPVITLTTDFGIRDGFTGVLKGVIWGICPGVQIADITHSITPQNVIEGAFALWRAAPFFPPGTVHIAGVDPGVGTKRRPMAAKLGEHYFVGPDNGLFTPLIIDAEKSGLSMMFVHLENIKYWLPDVSHTFHGRDIFGPVAAHLANGVPLAEFGTPIEQPERLVMPVPEKTAQGWKAHITVVDTFGNMTTDLSAGRLADELDLTIKVKGRVIDGLVESYGWRKPGDLVALVDSEGFVEIAVVNGSAASVLGMKVGDTVEITCK